MPDTMPDLLETDFIALRKIPYSEHAIIYSGISPDYGRIGFLVPGAQGGYKRAFPELELFRLVHLQFIMGSGELCRIKTVELLESFDELTQSYARYEAANWIAAFCALNLMPMLPHPHFANAVEVALRRLAKEQLLPEAILTGVCLAFIFEEGWLSSAIQTPEASEQCKILLEMAAGNPPPTLTDESWRQQFDWCRQLLLYNDCKLPE
ncbi:MAG: recombination protein O N-terminal domain-containing protein [Victivallales bacterium]|nr:recombination protein O N-terminal domain-containing protein [Victivallales bacterium]